jgi:hypothetical protein
MKSGIKGLIIDFIGITLLSIRDSECNDVLSLSRRRVKCVLSIDVRLTGEVVFK